MSGRSDPVATTAPLSAAAGRPALDWALLPVVWLCWGLSYPFMAWAMEAADILTLRLVANAGAGLLLLALCGGATLRGRLPDRSDWAGIAVAGTLNMVLFPFALLAGVLLVGPGQSAIMTYTMPVWASLLAVPVLGERLDRRTVAALALGLAAILAVVAGNAMQESPSALGILLGLSAGAFFGAGTVASKAFAWRTPMPVVTAWQLLLATLPSALLWLALHRHTYLHAGTPHGLFGAVYMIVFANALAYFAWFRLVGRMRASVASLSLLVVPVIGVASSALLSLRRIGAMDVLALALVLASIAVLVVRRGPTR